MQPYIRYIRILWPVVIEMFNLYLINLWYIYFEKMNTWNKYKNSNSEMNMEMYKKKYFKIVKDI